MPIREIRARYGKPDGRVQSENPMILEALKQAAEYKGGARWELS